MTSTKQSWNQSSVLKISTEEITILTSNSTHQVPDAMTSGHAPLHYLVDELMVRREVCSGRPEQWVVGVEERFTVFKADFTTYAAVAIQSCPNLLPPRRRSAVVAAALLVERLRHDI
jgi:hypothetical protein